MSGTPENPNSGLPHCPGFLRENIKAYLDGELAPLRRGVVRWHLARCAACREESAWLRRLGEDMRTLEKSAPRPELRRRILAGLPPPAPMRPPLKIWRPEPNFARFAPNFALGGVLAVFALGGAFALSRAPQTAPAHNPTASAPVLITQNQPVFEPITAEATQTKTDPFAASAVIDDPTSRKANALYREAAHRLAAQRRREALLASAQTAAKTASAAPTILTLTPNAEAGDTSNLSKRLEALTLQAGGTMKTILPAAQAGSLRVAPSVPLEDHTLIAPVAPTPAAIDGMEIALRIPRQQIKPFVAALQALGTLKRAPAPLTKSKPDQTAARTAADESGFVTFRVRLLPVK